jgi:hypothetical protein
MCSGGGYIWGRTDMHGFYGEPEEKRPFGIRRAERILLKRA